VRDASGRFAGTLYRTAGPPFNSASWSAITVTEVGSMTLAFAGNDRAALTYSVDGVTVAKTIERQVFSTPPTCTLTSEARGGATNYQDLWWNPTESGWGLNLTHQGLLMFATLFVYAPDGRPMWLVASSLARQPDGTFTGDLYRTSGPPFNASPWSAIQVTPVGTMTLVFASGQSALLVYTVNGARVTQSIQRQVFGTRPTVCR